MTIDVVWVGELVIVEAISKVGASLINKHGVLWRTFRVLENGDIMLESTDGKEATVWIMKNDENMKIVSVVNPDTI